jgi:DNA polymerase-3 subunit gamma/tau
MAKRKQAAASQPLPSGPPPQQSPAAAAPPSGPQSYTVLARRYRPQQFSDIVGQEPVAQALVNALQSNRVAHAYLFTGARGVGKTSTARILAKALNCVKGPTPTPCDQCDICQGIAAGDDVDVVEIDGASNNSVENIRELRQNVQYKPNRARFKIYIIDEVHMLTTSAFNALLKTLEEPPPHIKFIFATTDTHKVPVTVLSRCQRFDFGTIGPERIIARLKEVLAAEKMQAEDEALELIARRAGGSMRDAQSLLDQLLAFGGDRLMAEQVHRLLGTTPPDRVLDLAGAILDHDAARALHFLDGAASQGLQLGELLDQLVDYWRDLMVVHCAGTEARDLSVPARHRDRLQQQAKSVSIDTILAGLDILATARNRLRGSTHVRIWLEMALVRLARLEDLVPVAQLAKWLATGGELPAATSRQPSVSGNPSPRPADGPPGSPSRPLAAAALASRTAMASPPAEANPGPLSLTPETVGEVWPKVLGKFEPSLATSLQFAGLPAISGPNSLVIRFPADYNAFYKRFQDAEGRDRLAALLRQLTGKPWSVQIESAGLPGTDRHGGTEPAGHATNRTRQQREEVALREPLVQRAKEVLKANINVVDEGFGAAGQAERTDPTETPEEA